MSLREVSIKDFVAFVESTPEHLRDKHWISQHLLNLCDVINIDRIVKLEKFNQEIIEIWKNLFDLEIDLGLNLCANKVMRNKTYLTKEIADDIYRIYEKDFNIFGYERDSWEGL